MVTKEEKIAYSILAAIFLVLTVLIVTLVILKTKDSDTFVPSGGNGAAEEKFFDSSIPDATLTLEFIAANIDESGRAPRWCTETYYSYRLVNRKTGGYGNLSPWSAYPVVSSPDAVSPNPTVAVNACNMIAPTVGFQPTIDITTDIVYNVHRQASGLNPSSVGEVVGILLPATTSWQDGGKTVRYYTKFIDGNNPNKTTGVCETCG